MYYQKRNRPVFFFFNFHVEFKMEEVAIEVSKLEKHPGRGESMWIYNIVTIAYEHNYLLHGVVVLVWSCCGLAVAVLCGYGFGAWLHRYVWLGRRVLWIYRTWEE
jgi:hypothetical protein